MAGRPDAQHTFDRFCQGHDNYVCDQHCLVDLREIRSISDRVEALKIKVADVLDQVQQRRGQVEGFYIGKTYVDKKDRVPNFEAMNPRTWKKEGISSRWQNKYKPRPQNPYERENPNCNGLIVLTVVTEEMLPPNPENEDVDDNRSHTNQQDYALMLEQRLLHNYKIEAYNPKIRNDSFGEGYRGRMRPGFAVYVAVKLEENVGRLGQQFGGMALDD